MRDMASSQTAAPRQPISPLAGGDAGRQRGLHRGANAARHRNHHTKAAKAVGTGAAGSTNPTPIHRPNAPRKPHPAPPSGNRRISAAKSPRASGPTNRREKSPSAAASSRGVMAQKSRGASRSSPIPACIAPSQSKAVPGDASPGTALKGLASPRWSFARQARPSRTPPTEAPRRHPPPPPRRPRSASRQHPPRSPRPRRRASPPPGS